MTDNWTDCGYFMMKTLTEKLDVYHPDPDVSIAVSALYERYLKCQDSEEVKYQYPQLPIL